MRRGRGVLKGLVLWEGEGNIIFIQIKRNQGTPFDQLLSKNLFDGFEINKQHLSCSECFNQLAFQHLNCKSSQQPLPIVLIRLNQDDTVRLRARFTQQQYLSPKKKAVSCNLKSRAEYLCRSRKINFRGGKSRVRTNYRRLTEINSRYYGLLLMRTLTRGPCSIRCKGS